MAKTYHNSTQIYTSGGCKTDPVDTGGSQKWFVLGDKVYRSYDLLYDCYNSEI